MRTHSVTLVIFVLVTPRYMVLSWGKTPLGERRSVSKGPEEEDGGMKKSLGLICIVLAASWAVAQQDATAVEPMDQTPVFRVKVVSRSTKAVNYRHRGGSPSWTSKEPA